MTVETTGILIVLGTKIHSVILKELSGVAIIRLRNLMIARKRTNRLDQTKSKYLTYE